MDRSRLTRWAAPIAFLAVITIGALVVRAGLHHGGSHHTNASTTTVTSTTKKKKTHGQQSKQVVKTYTVVSGDTLATIATKTGTSVATLERLNPGIDPQALHIGQKIRVQ